jgi:UDP-N-acetylmuramoyl-L-alanyl-D-glutamate--2,6-diaminopimelate ligase
MENYYRAKKKLFSDLLAPGAVAVVNTDDVHGRRIVSEVGGGKILSCGFDGKPDFRIGDFEGDAGGVRFSIESEGVRHRIESGLCGRYNAMNIAESFALAMRLGVEPEKMLEVLGRGIRVPGRLESFPLRSGAVAFVDYAHTDDALEKVLSTLVAMRRGRMICVFGCGGDRDRSKRPRMGAAVAKFADVAIVTSDNPRSEDPLRIIREIMDGVKDAGKFICIPDRREAIEKAVGISRDGDIVLLAGKGHEKGQEVNGVIIPFDDREEMRKVRVQQDDGVC